MKSIAYPARISRNTSALLEELRSARLRHDHGDGPCPFISEAMRMVCANVPLDEVGTYLLRCGKPYSFVASLGMTLTDEFDLPFSNIDLESDMSH
jgi:hypothetical protein